MRRPRVGGGHGAAVAGLLMGMARPQAGGSRTPNCKSLHASLPAAVAQQQLSKSTSHTWEPWQQRQQRQQRQQQRLTLLAGQHAQQHAFQGVGGRSRAAICRQAKAGQQLGGDRHVRAAINLPQVHCRGRQEAGGQCEPGASGWVCRARWAERRAKHAAHAQALALRYRQAPLGAETAHCAPFGLCTSMHSGKPSSTRQHPPARCSSSVTRAWSNASSRSICSSSASATSVQHQDVGNGSAGKAIVHTNGQPPAQSARANSERACNASGACACS